MSAVRVLVLDNYDSFVYNLVQYLGEGGAEPIVHRSDAITLKDALGLHPQGVVISPGPGRPEDAGLSIDAIRAFAELGTPVLGVCLGHQAIGAAYGGKVVRAAKVMHGKTSEIFHKGEGWLDGLPIPFEATRYHSLVVSREGLPPELKITAETRDEVVMGLRHRDLPVEGVQFHPESILSRDGRRIIENFLWSLSMPDSRSRAAVPGLAATPAASPTGQTVKPRGAEA
jgi:anthranilate synthase/aminodeoxychorismate synthase-like glutamine amidotransferase